MSNLIEHNPKTVDELNALYDSARHLVDTKAEIPKWLFDKHMEFCGVRCQIQRMHVIGKSGFMYSFYNSYYYDNSNTFERITEYFLEQYQPTQEQLMYLCNNPKFIKVCMKKEYPIAISRVFSPSLQMDKMILATYPHLIVNPKMIVDAITFYNNDKVVTELINRCNVDLDFLYELHTYEYMKIFNQDSEYTYCNRGVSSSHYNRTYGSPNYVIASKIKEIQNPQDRFNAMILFMMFDEVNDYTDLTKYTLYPQVRSKLYELIAFTTNLHSKLEVIYMIDAYDGNQYICLNFILTMELLWNNKHTLTESDVHHIRMALFVSNDKTPDIMRFALPNYYNINHMIQSSWNNNWKMCPGPMLVSWICNSCANNKYKLEYILGQVDISANDFVSALSICRLSDVMRMSQYAHITADELFNAIDKVNRPLNEKKMIVRKYLLYHGLTKVYASRVNKMK